MRKINSGNNYFRQRHSYLIRQLSDIIEKSILELTPESFLHDRYPDYLTLEQFRNDILNNNPELTTSFLQEGCPFEWLIQIADLIITSYLEEPPHLSPRGDASTTSVTSSSLS